MGSDEISLLSDSEYIYGLGKIKGLYANLSILDRRLKPGENIFDAYQRQRKDVPPLDKTTSAVESTKIQPREEPRGNQFVEALKMANQGFNKG